LAAQILASSSAAEADDDAVWFGEPSTEITLASDRYDFILSLVHLDEAISRPDYNPDQTIDTYDRMTRQSSVTLT